MKYEIKQSADWYTIIGKTSNYGPIKIGDMLTDRHNKSKRLIKVDLDPESPCWHLKNAAGSIVAIQTRSLVVSYLTNKRVERPVISEDRVNLSIHRLDGIGKTLISVECLLAEMNEKLDQMIKLWTPVHDHIMDLNKDRLQIVPIRGVSK